MELSRRKWPTLELGSLQTWRKRDIVEAFLRRSLTGWSTGEEFPPRGRKSCQGAGQAQPQGSTATFLTGVDITDDGTTGLSMGIAASGVPADDGDERIEHGSPPGLVLFPSMIENILSK